ELLKTTPDKARGNGRYRPIKIRGFLFFLFEFSGFRQCHTIQPGNTVNLPTPVILWRSFGEPDFSNPDFAGKPVFRG
ncbi:MAG: hypothetical protein ABR955_13785, partial [Verrucomicrobiota bacterium]